MVLMKKSKGIAKKFIGIILSIVIIVTEVGYVDFSINVNADTGTITLYFIDNTSEKWLENDDAVIQLVDNTNGHKYYDMIKIDDITWSVNVPKEVYNVTFNRLNSSKSIQWNSWSAGGRDFNNSYYVDGAEYGHWGIIESDNKENYFHAGDIVYLDLTEFTAWENDKALMYINFTDASKENNYGNDIYFSIANKSQYNPEIVNCKISDYIYAYEVTDEDEGSNVLRFWRGNSSILWNCSELLTYNEYKSGINCIKIKNWNDSSDKCISSYKYLTDEKITLYDFEADMYDIYIGVDTLVTFTVSVVSNDVIYDNEICVYDENNQMICTMNDSGINGDEIANDGIFTGQSVLSSYEIELVQYYSSISNIISNTFEISFYRNLTQNEFVAFTKLLNIISSLSFDEACIFVQNSAEIRNFSINTEERTIIYQSIYGISGMWEEYNDINFKGNGEYAISQENGIDYTYAEELIDSANITQAQNKHDVIVLRPFRNTDFQYDDFQLAGNLIAQALNGTVTTIDDENVTLNVMKQLSSYGNILIDSHGTKSGKKIYMLIGEKLNENKFLWDPIYYVNHVSYSADYLSGRIYCTKKDNRLAVGKKFFEKYYSKRILEDSFWYLGTCYSMYNNSIAKVLTEKGAGAVIGYSDSVTVTYCNNCLFETIINSMIISADTVSNSVNCAKEIYGYKDSGNTLTELKLYGNSDFKLVNNFGIAVGKLTGKICKASNHNMPINNAIIQIYRDDEFIMSITSDSEGNYSTDIEAGNYKISIFAKGYIIFNAYINVSKDKITYLETFLLINNSDAINGIATGTIYDAISGDGIEGVSLSVRSGWNNTTVGNVLSTFSTNSFGEFSVTLPLGNYTIYAIKDGYVSNYINIIVQEGTTSSQNGTLVKIADNDTYRIVLTWGENPRDLDSHVTGTLSNNNLFHVYYLNKLQYDGKVEICNLDVDDTSSYGPETITLKPINDKPYYYYVYRFSGSGTVSTSEAQVKVYKGEKLIRIFNVPSNLGDGDYWNVFAISDGKIIINNTITSSANINYAD